MAVGPNVEIRRFAGSSTRVIDLRGRLLIPGINDAHVHVPDVFRATTFDVAGAESFPEVAHRLATAARETRTGWLTAEPDFALLDDPSVTRDALDAVVSSQPVILKTLGGHAALLNSEGLRQWSISDIDPDPPGGWYGRDGSGRLDGWLYEYAYWKKNRDAQKTASEAEFITAFQEFGREAARLGITTVQNMPIPLIASRAVELLRKAETLIRWRIIRFQMGEIARLSPRRDVPGPEAMVRATGIKYILDGTPIERGAALRAPYSDRPRHSGRMNYTRPEIARMIEESSAGGEPLLLHVVGDLALVEVFDELRRRGTSPPRLRLEHADMLTPDLLDDARRFGAVVVQNPSHLTLTSLARTRLGDERRETIFPLRSLLDRGIPLALGSDGPLNPYLNMMFALMHPINPKEALTREQALDAYTRGAAYAEFAESAKGALAPGMLADLAVLSQDLFTIPLEQFPATVSELTIVGGRIVHVKTNPQP